MLRGISWKKFLEWVAYAELEPFDEVRADSRAASVCAVLANVHRDPKKRPKPFSVEDFLLVFGDEKKSAAPQRQTWQEQKAIALMWAAIPEDTRPRRRKKR